MRQAPMVRVTTGRLEGREGFVVGTDDKHGENIVKIDGEEYIVPDDGLEVVQ
jgi:hypothetical protein